MFDNRYLDKGQLDKRWWIKGSLDNEYLDKECHWITSIWIKSALDKRWWIKGNWIKGADTGRLRGPVPNLGRSLTPGFALEIN